MYGPPSCSKKRGIGSCARSGSLSTTSWHGASPTSAGSSGASRRAPQERPEAALVDAERLGDERAAGQQIRDEGQLAAVHARDAHRVAVERDEPCGESGRRIERLADLDQPAVVRELREPRPQRLRVSSSAPSSPERTSATTSPRSGPIESPAATKP